MPFRLLVRCVVLVAGVGLAAASARAADCLGVADNPLAVARVKANTDKVFFLANTGGGKAQCPSDEAACRQKAFLLAGDEVLVQPTDGRYFCATFLSTKGVQTHGWLSRAALDLLPADGAPRAWQGKWVRDVEASLTLRPQGDQIAVAGEATWGLGDPDRVKRGGVHIGEIDAQSKPNGTTLIVGATAWPVETDDCAARLKLLSRYLLVDDNKNCGGMNVSFDGIYVRTGPSR